MDIMDIRNKRVKVGKSSITVKDDAGKTLGVVTNATPFMDMSPSKKCEYHLTMRKSGIGMEGARNIVEKDGELYFLHDITPIETYKTMKKTHPDSWFLGELEGKIKINSELANAASKHFTVLECFVIK